MSKSRRKNSLLKETIKQNLLNVKEAMDEFDRTPDSVDYWDESNQLKTRLQGLVDEYTKLMASEQESKDTLTRFSAKVANASQEIITALQTFQPDEKAINARAQETLRKVRDTSYLQAPKKAPPRPKTSPPTRDELSSTAAVLASDEIQRGLISGEPQPSSSSTPDITATYIRTNQPAKTPQKPLTQEELAETQKSVHERLAKIGVQKARAGIVLGAERKRASKESDSSSEAEKKSDSSPRGPKK